MTRFAWAAAAAASFFAPAAIAQGVPVSFGTNWVAEAEHGGYYQAVADGTYAACGLDVTIVPGGPQVNNRALLLAGKIDYHMGGDLLFQLVRIPQVVRIQKCQISALRFHNTAISRKRRTLSPIRTDQADIIIGKLLHDLHTAVR